MSWSNNIVVPLGVKDDRTCRNPCAGSTETTWASKGSRCRDGALQGWGWQAERSAFRDSSQAICSSPCSLNPSAMRGWRALSTSRKHCQKKPLQCCYAGAIMSKKQNGIATCKRAGAISDSPGAPTHTASPPRGRHGARSSGPCSLRDPVSSPGASRTLLATEQLRVSSTHPPHSTALAPRATSSPEPPMQPVVPSPTLTTA